MKRVWDDKDRDYFKELIQVEMPQDAPGTLANAETTELLAFILEGNRRPAGDVRGDERGTEMSLLMRMIRRKQIGRHLRRILHLNGGGSG